MTPLVVMAIWTAALHADTSGDTTMDKTFHETLAPTHRFLVNNDGTNLFWRDDLSLDMVRRHAAECPDVVTTYLLCPNGIQKMLYPSQYEELTARGGLRRLVEAGEDPFGLFIEELRRRGFEVFITFRMNEVHNVDNPDDPDLSAFWREHPEYRVERGSNPKDWLAQCLDYSLEPVRKRSLALIFELMEKYQPDGIELDWIRFPRHLSGTPEEVWNQRDHLTTVMSAVHQKALEMAQKTGKTMQVAARIPSSLAGCRYVGLDVAQWTALGIVDFLTMAPFLSSDFRMPIAELREALGDRPVPIYACIEVGYSALHHSEQTLCGAALGLLDSGADGIYLFNFPCWREMLPHPPWAWVTSLHNPELLLHKELGFALLNQSHRIPHVDLPTPLPVRLAPGQKADLTMDLPRILFSGNRRPVRARVTTTPANITLQWNGQNVDDTGSVAVAALQSGANTLTVENKTQETVDLTQLAVYVTPPLFTPIQTEPVPSSVSFVVSPSGSDENPGTESAPFKTLARAQRAVRQVLQVQKPTSVTVLLRGGTYRLNEPLVFTPEDSSGPETCVIFHAWEGEKPVISGGRVLSNWQQDDSGKWQTTAELDRFRHFFVNGKRAVRASRDCTGEATRIGDWDHVDGLAGFAINKPEMAHWRNPQDIELGFFTVWAHMIVKVDKILPGDNGTAQVYLRQPQLYLAAHKEGVQIQQPAYIENALELLDEPGEWYVDPTTRTLHYLPHPGEDMASAETVVPVLEQLVRIEGEPSRPVHHIIFQGIAFAETTWLRPEQEGHIDVQANFTITPDNVFSRNGNLAAVHNEYRKSPGAIVLRHAVGCRFEDCTFTKLGGAGLDIESGCINNLIASCRFEDISGTAIQIGDVTAEDHHPSDARMSIRNTHVLANAISRCGVEFEGSVGIFVGYAIGTVLAHNEISHLPYSGISMGWGWGEEDAGGGAYEEIPYRFAKPTPAGNNRILYNHIHHVMLRRDDGGAIYTLGNQPGSVIRANYIHDCGPGRPGGIYLDEGSGFIEITENVVHNVATAMNYNNRAQDRITTCFEHDNFFDTSPEANDLALKIAQAAGPGGIGSL